MSSDVVIPENELPDWMRQAQRGVDWGVLITIALSLLLAWPLLLGNGLPRSNYVEAYLFRASDTVTAIEEGWLYPRWSPHAQGGYGAPVPNFYPPGVPYTVALIHIFFTDDLPLAMAYLMILAFAIAGSGTYVLAAKYGGAATGLVAAMLYLFNPYMGISVPHIIGDPAQVLAAALLPSLLWSLYRLLYINRQQDWVLSALITAALLLTEPRFYLIGCIISAGFVIYETRDKAQHGRPILRALSAGIIGTTLASFYWLPAMTEQIFIQWHNTGNISLPLQASLSTLIQPAEYTDPLLMISAPQPGLGAAILLLSLIGLGFLLWQRRLNTMFIFLLMGFAQLLFLLLIVPGEIWLLIPILLCLAIGSSQIMNISKQDPDLQRLLFGSVLIFLSITSLPAWFSQLRGIEHFSYTPATQLRFEQQGFGIAVLPPNTDIPSSLPLNFEVNRDLINFYTQGEINRFGQELISRNQATILSSSTQSHRFQIRSREISTVTILLAYFPGWEAYLNGRRIPLRPDPNTGLILIDLPSDSSGELDIRFSSSPIRQNAWLLSFSALAIMIIYTAHRWRLQNQRYYETSPLLSLQDARFILLIIGCVAAISAASNVRLIPLVLRPDPGHSLEGVHLLAYRTETGLEALAYTFEGSSFQAGDTLQIDLFWQALRFLPDNFQTSIQLRNAETGLIVASSEPHHIGYYPTRRWPRGASVLDRHYLQISSTTDPGRYIIEIELLRCGENCEIRERLQFFNRSGQSIGSLVTLPQIITIR